MCLVLFALGLLEKKFKTELWRTRQVCPTGLGTWTRCLCGTGVEYLKISKHTRVHTYTRLHRSTPHNPEVLSALLSNFRKLFFPLNKIGNDLKGILGRVLPRRSY